MKNKDTKRSAIFLLPAMLAAFPYVAYAQGSTGPGTLHWIAGEILRLLNLLVPVFIALAIVLFFWGLAKFMLSAGDTARRSSGISLMIWGVIALFVIVSVWGLVAVLQRTFNIGAAGNAVAPGSALPPGSNPVQFAIPPTSGF